MTSAEIRERLEYLRGELRAERMSYGEIAELQGLAEHIDPGDVELLEAAGVPEHPAHEPGGNFTVAVHTEGAAFAPDPGPELCRILRAIADRIEGGDSYDTFRTILDVNGNDVGRYALKPEWRTS
jgi:hypothetical protein